MIIKPTKYKKCKCCKQNIKIISHETYGCDICGKEINMNSPERDYLQFTIHYHSNESQWIHACSWKCAIKKVRQIINEKSSDYFISLPFVSFDTTTIGCRVVDFIKELKRI